MKGLVPCFNQSINQSTFYYIKFLEITQDIKVQSNVMQKETS